MKAVPRTLLCALCLGLAVTACKRTDPEPEPLVVPAPPTRDAAPATGLAEHERAFAAEAATAALAQIEAGRLAAMRTSNETVRGFAEQIERDYAAIQDALQALVRDMGMELPNTVAGEMRATLDELAGESGSEFDRRYIREFGVNANMKAIELFERQARAGEHPELRALADRSLSLLRDDLTAAQRLQGQQA